MSQKAVIINLPESEAENIYAEDMASIINGLLGGKSGILPTGNQLAAQKVNNNTVRLSSGDYSNQGYIVRIPGGESIDLTIENGYQDLKRYDLIVSEYRRTASGEYHEIKVIKGSPALSPSVPALTQGNLNNGAELRQEAIYLIKINGLNIESITRQASVISPSAQNVITMGTAPPNANTPGNIYIQY